jgi:hypothetical protein
VNAAAKPTRFSSDMAGGSATAAAEGGAGPRVDDSARCGLRLRDAAGDGGSCLLRSCSPSASGCAMAVRAFCCLLELLQR